MTRLRFWSLRLFVFEATLYVPGFTTPSNLVLSFLRVCLPECAPFLIRWPAGLRLVPLLYCRTNRVALFLDFLWTEWILYSSTRHNWIKGSHCILPITNLSFYLNLLQILAQVTCPEIFILGLLHIFDK